MDKTDEQVLRHLLDLSKTAYNKNIDIFSDFLSIRESALLKEHEREIITGRYYSWGGAEDCERVMVCFPSDRSLSISDAAFPIKCVLVTIRGQKFAQGKLSHRDFLGSVLGLGIERRLIGDINLINDGNAGAYIFCHDRILDFLTEELTHIGRYEAECFTCDPQKVISSRITEQKSGTVASLRLDSVVGEVFGLSRTKIKELIESGLVSVNAAMTTRPHLTVNEGDVISARGYGKFKFLGEDGQTRKNRIRILFEIYK